ncbi:hypothetical protein DPEC_G00169080 [Dallia pectoralis]|uniref:Uncharacterized protein n=1 Tax=Dallia pectoralis TaxID=75939 RepID=A0ACC2GCK2_DALPE|nr:hypothetical protein DPEC_G00169080 [Dallia pectoralis]
MEKDSDCRTGPSFSSPTGPKPTRLMCPDSNYRLQGSTLGSRLVNGERKATSAVPELQENRQKLKTLYPCPSYIRSKNLRAHKLTHQRTAEGREIRKDTAASNHVKVKEEEEVCGFITAEGEDVGWSFPGLRESTACGSRGAVFGSGRGVCGTGGGVCESGGGASGSRGGVCRSGFKGGPSTSCINQEAESQSSTKARESPDSDQRREEDIGMNVTAEEEEVKKKEEDGVGGFINSEGEEVEWDSIQHHPSVLFTQQ